MSRLLTYSRKNDESDEEADAGSRSAADKFDPVKRLAMLKKDVKRDVLKRFGFLNLDLDFVKKIKTDERELFQEPKAEVESSNLTTARNTSEPFESAKNSEKSQIALPD